MRIDYFSVETPEGVTLEQILQNIRSLPDDDSRVKYIGDVPYRMQELTFANKLWEGDFMRIRMNDIPIIVSLDGDTADVDLDDDEGLGEETAFLYDPATRVIALQRNRFGISATRAGLFFDQIGAVDGILLVQIPRDDSDARLLRLNLARKFQIRFSNVTNLALITKHQPSTAEAIRLLADKAPVVDITISMGHARGSLNIQSLIAAAKRLVKRAKDPDGSDDVEQIKVFGSFDEDSMQELNLLDYFVADQIDVPVDPKRRRMLYADRQPAIRKSFASQRTYLRKLFP